MDEILQVVEDINTQNEYVEPVDTVEMLNKYEKFKVDFEYLQNKNKSIDVKNKKTRRELRIINEIVEKINVYHFSNQWSATIYQQQNYFF